MKKTFEQIQGPIYKDECLKLQELAEDKICLELGALNGKSTVALAQIARIVLSLDTFQSNNEGNVQTEMITTLDQFKDNIDGYSNIKYVIAKTEIVPVFFEDQSFDFIFMDADHSYKAVYDDIKNCWPKLKRGGVIACHDYEIPKHPGVKRAFDELLKEPDGVVRWLAWKNKGW